MRQGSRNNCLKYSSNQATLRAAHYASVSERTIKQIRKEHKQRQESDPNTKLSTPGKKHRTSPQQITVFVDDFDRCVIRTIHDFYLRERKVPLPKLLPVIKNRISFPWGKRSLHKIMRYMGFKWKTCRSQRKVLLERLDIVT
jgi:hypothetical protein